ncbi:hypothetical protein [Nonomuraea turcica]|uniref:hypothetical protein n=1 Tax=Nonomuraea sp. G32 TaxID=3067274 RepID=UPI00273BF4CC|nr:hypothetical protein [Nonomuraea sp. G32]MDP4501123.1 hypothetical protein [Nonomuraea sp. G32]
MSAHVYSPRPVSTGTNRPPFYRWSCSCGRESANFYGYEAQAKRAHADHAQAKGNG